MYSKQALVKRSVCVCVWKERAILHSGNELKGFENKTLLGKAKHFQFCWLITPVSSRCVHQVPSPSPAGANVDMVSLGVS